MLGGQAAGPPASAVGSLTWHVWPCAQMAHGVGLDHQQRHVSDGACQGVAHAAQTHTEVFEFFLGGEVFKDFQRRGMGGSGLEGQTLGVMVGCCCKKKKVLLALRTWSGRGPPWARGGRPGCAGWR